MLESNTFKSIVESAPLVSIDICLVYQGKILLGKRNNQPLLGQWFTPSGRIFKNERWQECIRKVAGSELGITIEDPANFKLMGVCDHFYENSVMDEKVSTHYDNLPHHCRLMEKPKLTMDHQHNDWPWFGLEKIAVNNSFHKYIRNYASRLINVGIDND